MVPYFALAKGFLTGKYRDGVTIDSPRAGGAAQYLARPRAAAVLAVLDEVANARGASVASVALAWLAAQPTVVAPIASARNTQQLADLVASVELHLSEDELRLLPTRRLSPRRSEPEAPASTCGRSAFHRV